MSSQTAPQTHGTRIRPEIKRAIEDWQLLPELRQLLVDERAPLQARLAELHKEYEAARFATGAQIGIAIAHYDKDEYRPLFKTSGSVTASLDKFLELQPSALSMLAHGFAGHVTLVKIFHGGPATDDAAGFVDFVTESLRWHMTQIEDPNATMPTSTYRAFMSKKAEAEERLLDNWRKGVTTDADRDYFAKMLRDDLDDLPGLDINSEMDDDHWDSIHDKDWFEKQTSRRAVQPPTLYRRSILSHALSLTATNQIQHSLLEPLVGFLRLVAKQLPELRTLEQQLNTLYREEKELEAEAKVSVHGLTTTELTLDETIVIATERSLPLDRSSMVRAFVEHPTRATDPYWINWWLVSLYDELRAGLRSTGLSAPRATTLLDQLTRFRRMAELNESLRADTPTISLTLRTRCLWLREIVRQATAQGIPESKIDAAGGLLSYLQLPPVTVVATEWLTSNSDAGTHFTKTISACFNDWIGMSFAAPSSLHHQPAAVRIAALRRQRTTLEHMAERVTEPTEPTVASLSGLVYFPRLNPEASTQDEQQRLKQVLERRAFELVTCAFDQTEQITLPQWQNETTEHLRRCLERLSWPDTGHPGRLATQLFEHLTTPSTRSYHSYADGVNNFHPAGGSRDYYLVCRILELPELGNWLVWRYAKTIDEHRR